LRIAKRRHAGFGGNARAGQRGDRARTAQACDVMMLIGTAAEVYPAAALPMTARAHGATIVEINPHATALTHAADHTLRGAAGVVLPALVQAVWP